MGLMEAAPWENGDASNTRRRLKSDWRKRPEALKRQQISSLTARPGNYFYGGLARLRRPLTSTSG
jgi:hypothetical protein